jgi:hypothetical protein
VGSPRHTLIAIAVALVLVVGAEAGTVPAAATPTTTKPSSVTAKLRLDKKRVKEGSKVKGRLVLTNPTDRTIDLSDDCAPQWDVVLGTGKKAPPIAFSQLCAVSPFPVAPGHNRYPFRVSTQGLDPGKYHAFLVASDPSFPHAKPARVVIVATP